MFGFGERSKEPKKEERMPAARVVAPEEVPKEIAGGALSAEGSKENGFGGYATLDGELIGGRTEMKRFEDARGFSLVDNASSRPATPKTSQQEVIVSAQVVTAEADLTRQRALEMPEGLEGEALIAALEAKRDAFQKYLEEKWQKKMWVLNPEKDADLECLAKLQGRVTGARRKAKSDGTKEMLLKKIEKTKLAQMHADVLSVQQSLLAELNRTSVTEADMRRHILAEISQLGVLLKPEREQDLRKWSDAHAQPLSSVGEDDQSEWSR